MRRRSTYSVTFAFVALVGITWGSTLFADTTAQTHPEQNQESTAGSVPCVELFRQIQTHTIVVDEGQDIFFALDVLTALRHICPCLRYNMSDDGEISLQTPILPDGTTDPEFCECYCKHKTGCNLILNLSLNSRTTTIKPSYSTNRHRKGKVKWNPEKEQFVNDEEANRLLTRSMRSPWTMG